LGLHGGRSSSNLLEKRSGSLVALQASDGRLWGHCSRQHRRLPSGWPCQALAPEPPIAATQCQNGWAVCSAGGSAVSRRLGPQGRNLRVAEPPPSSRWLQPPGSKTSSAASGNGSRRWCAPVAAEAGSGAVQRSPGDRLSIKAAVGQRWRCDVLLADCGVPRRRRQSDAAGRGADATDCPPGPSPGDSVTSVKRAAEAATRSLLLAPRSSAGSGRRTAPW